MTDEKGVGGLPDAGTIAPGDPGHIETHDQMAELMQAGADALGIILDPPAPKPAVIGEYGHVDAHNTLLANIEQIAAAGGGFAGGKILQVVRATDSIRRDTTSTDFIDVTAGSMWVSISPQSTSSALLLIGHIQVQVRSANDRAVFRITDSDDNPIPGAEDSIFGALNFDSVGTNSLTSSLTLIGYHTPATTSSRTYKMQFRSEAGASVSVVNDRMTGQLYALEIGA